MAAEAVKNVFEILGRSLGRLLRYSAGGFLAIVIATKVNPVGAKQFFDALPWQLATLAAIVIGTCIYALHRSFVIPISHWVLTGIFWLWDWWNGTERKDSLSPTRWFNDLGVKRFRRIFAYDVLRRDAEFISDEKEQERLGLAHAESGLVIMAGEACWVAAWYAWGHPSSHPSCCVWFFLGLFLWVAHLPSAFLNHAMECSRWRDREKNEKDEKGNFTKPVTSTLKKYGLLMRDTE